VLPPWKYQPKASSPMIISRVTMLSLFCITICQKYPQAR
jgi:hypothetical protein